MRRLASTAGRPTASSTPMPTPLPATLAQALAQAAASGLPRPEAHMLLPIYGTLKSLGLSSHELTPFLPVVHFNDDKTNVYTIYYYFIKDFGYFSVLIFQLLYGFFYGSFYYSIKKRYFTPLKVIVFALFAYPLVISFFQETLLSLLTTHINRIIYAFVIYMAADLLSRVRFTTRGRKVSV